MNTRALAPVYCFCAWLAVALSAVHGQEAEECDACIGDRDVQPVITTLFGQWTATPYGKPRMEQSDRHLIIDSRGQHQAGLTVARDLDRAQKYRLVIDGDELRQRTGLRIKRIKNGVEEPEFGAAPVARIELVLADVERIELVFYNDGEFSYKLKELRLEPCAACFSDRELRSRIVDEVPALAHLLKAGRTIEAALALTGWVANSVDWGWEDNLVARNSDAVYWQPATSGYDIWASDRGGALCGAFAIYLIKILDLFGIDSFSVNFGYPVRLKLSHVSTILPIKDRDRYRFYVVDPTFNASFVDRASGRLLHLEDVLRRYTSRRRDFLFKERPITRQHFIPPDTLPEVERVLAGLGRPVSCTAGGLVPDGRNCTFRFDALFYTQYKKHDLAAVGYPAGDDLFMNLFSQAVSDLGGQSSVEIRRAFKQLLERYRIKSPAAPR